VAGMGGHEVMRIGSVVRILKPHGFTIDAPVAILIGKVEYVEEGEKQVAWHCLCDDRMILLTEDEFEVIG
jgi:hypothetical protein